jgi:UDP-N-acetylmuramate dehydrogenase
VQDDPAQIRARMADIKSKRESSQPIKEKTGGSTFANPKPEDLTAAGLPIETRAWQLVDKVGGRGLKIGGAMMSDLHANFMINTGDATAADLEQLGDEIKRRIKDQLGVDMRWEIKRVGEK